MKKKFILLPITLTALTPMISMVSCNEPEPSSTDEVIIDDFNYISDTGVIGMTRKVDIVADNKYCFVINIDKFIGFQNEKTCLFHFSSIIPFGWIAVENNGQWFTCVEEIGNASKVFSIKRAGTGELSQLTWIDKNIVKNDKIKIHILPKSSQSNIDVQYWQDL